MRSACHRGRTSPHPRVRIDPGRAIHQAERSHLRSCTRRSARCTTRTRAIAVRTSSPRPDAVDTCVRRGRSSLVDDHSGTPPGRSKLTQASARQPRNTRRLDTLLEPFASTRRQPGVAESGLRCSGGGTRTHNLRINSPPLCQLSYPGRVGHRCYRTRTRVRVYDAGLHDHRSRPRSLGCRRDRLRRLAHAREPCLGGRRRLRRLRRRRGRPPARARHARGSPPPARGDRPGRRPSRSSAPRGTIPPT